MCRASAGTGLPQGCSLQLLGALNCCRRHSSASSLSGSVSPLNRAADNSLFGQRALTLAYFKKATRAEAAEPPQINSPTFGVSSPLNGKTTSAGDFQFLSPRPRPQIATAPICDGVDRPTRDAASVSGAALRVSDETERVITRM